MASTSGTYDFSPSVADLVRESFERIQIFPPALTIQHIVSARTSLNLWLADVGAGNMGVSLFAVDQIAIPLLPGQVQFPLPSNTVELLDVYVRTFTAPDSDSFVNIGNALTPIGPAGNPLVAQPYGDPLLIQPASQTLSATAGSNVITLRWPNHGMNAGDPIFWEVPVSVGGLTFYGFSIVNTVVDSNTLQFLSPTPALETQSGQGGTPLLSTTSGSPNVLVIQPGHGQAVGDEYTIGVDMTIGGFTLTAGSTYQVTAVGSSYAFQFQPGGNASSTASAFLNGGRLSVATQDPFSSAPQDIIMMPLSRNDYASLPEKYVTGRPTTFWFDRIRNPNFSIYPVAPANSYYGFIAYRMRRIQDANPVNGEIPDLISRFWSAMTAALTAAVAEKFKPEVHAAKVALAEAAWERASSADVEHATMTITPMFGSYYR